MVSLEFNTLCIKVSLGSPSPVASCLCSTNIGFNVVLTGTGLNQNQWYSEINHIFPIECCTLAVQNSTLNDTTKHTPGPSHFAPCSHDVILQELIEYRFFLHMFDRSDILNRWCNISGVSSQNPPCFATFWLTDFLVLLGKIPLCFATFGNKGGFWLETPLIHGMTDRCQNISNWSPSPTCDRWTPPPPRILEIPDMNHQIMFNSKS